MNRIFTVLGIFLLFSFHLAAQTITGVSIPAGNYKVNDAITINFVSANTAGTALVAGSTVNGVALTGFTNLTGGNYSAIYTVVATNTDRASVGVIPINIGLTSGTDGPFFTAAATSGGTVTIDANSPTVSSIVKASTDPSNATNVNFTVTFNELVDATTLTTADFDLTLTGGVTATVNSVTPTTGTSTTFTVNVNAISTNEGTLRLNKTNNAYSDAIGNSSTTTFSSGEVYTIDRLAPSVSSIIKASTDPSNATNVNFTVTFSELVDATTLTTADFDLTLTGGVTATVNSVTPTTGTSTTFTVNVNTISANEGTLRLNKTNNAYSDAIGNSSTATFSPGAGGTYSIDRLAQSVSSIVRASTNPSNATNVNFTVTFSELIDATTITTADFDLTLTGGVTATINSVSPTTGTSTTFTVNVNAISANEGTLRLNKTNDAYSDAMGNSSTATFSAGEVYTIDRLAPTVSGIVRASADPTGASNVDFTVTFSELVDATTLTTADFDLTLTGGVTATVNSITPTAGTSTTFTVNVNAISNNQGTLQLNKTNNAYSDAIGNSSTATFSTGEVYTIDRLAPTADAPDAFQTVQSLKSGATSASQVRSTKNGAIYLVKNGTAVTSQAQINAAVTAKNAFLGRAVAVANTGYTITIPIASLINDGNYNIVAVDGSGNVSTPSSGADSWLTVDNTAPTVAITLVSASPTTASAGFLDFTVTFSESVTGVDITDFALASATVNDAVGTISNLSGSGSSYTVTVNTLAGNYANGTQAILNLDIIGSPGIADLATNSFGGSVTTDAQYLVDNTKPTVVQNDFTFNANGAAAETVVFTVSEPLNGSLTNNIAGFIIGGGSGTTNPIGVYNAGNGTVTLTNGGANATWGPGITVSYTPGNMSDLLANTMLAIGATPVSVPNVSLQAGDIAFTNINTKTGSGTGTGSGNGFSFVLLKNLPASTKIFFTNRGWDGTQLQAAGIDMTWTSPGSVTNAGTEVYFNGSNFVSGSNVAFGTTASASNINLEDNGDQILAYQGSLNSPLLFIAAINISSDGTLGADNWNTAASVGTDVNRSALPPGLTEGTNAISLALLNSTNVLDNGQYKLSGVAQEGSAQQLRSAMCTTANWNNRDANAYSASGVTYRIRPVITAVTIPNGTNYIISGTPYTATITVHDDRGSAHTLLASNIDGFSLSNLIRTNSTTYTADFTVTEGGNDVLAANNIPISVNLQSAQGNATAAVTPINTVALFTTSIAQANDPIDANSPYVFSINRQSSTNAWSTSGGTSATSVVFKVTFFDVMNRSTLTAADFSFSTTGLAGTPSISSILPLTDAASYDITVSGYTGTGTIGLNYIDSEAGPGGSVTDLIGNPTKSAALAADGSFTGQTFSIVLPEPDATAFAVTAPNVTQNSITLQWNSPNSPTPLPTHFLVLAAPTLGGSFPDLEDLIVAPGSHHVITPGALAQIIPRVSGTNTALFTGLQSGTSYDFKVYKYSLSANNSNDNIDYEMTNPGTITRVTNTASTSWLTLSSGAIPIGSTKDNSGASVPIMSFKIYDDGLDPIVPNVMSFNDNGLGKETITFSLREELATSLPSGSVLTGFTASSTGTTPINAVYYTSGPTVNIVTLTSPSDGDWNAATTINYNATGNVLFKTLGKMQSIANHAVSAGVANSVLYNNPVGTASFAVPAGVTSVVVETWGAGGSAGGWDNVYGGGSQGGGGGAYSRSVVPVTPGGSYDVTVGKGGVPVNPNFSTCCNAGQKGGSSIFSIPSGSSLVVAEGGDGGESGTYFAYYGTSYNGAIRPTTFGLGGKTSGGIGDIKYPGGNGGNGGGTLVTNSGTGPFPMGPNDAGGGGSSAGNAADGTPGAFASTGVCATCSSTGGNAPLFGGDGGTGFQNSTGASGVIPGGGGGGTGGAFASGAGADGQVKVTYYLPASTGTSDWAGDDSPFKFSQIVITKGPGNNNTYLGNWQDIIKGAELSDGTNFYNSSTNPSDITINPTNITFSNIPATIGVVPDAPNTTPSSKTYTVKIWLRNDLSPALASIVDGLNLEFSLDVSTAANLTYDDLSNSGQKSSRLASPALPFNSGTAQIQVDATQLDFSTNPNPSAFVLANVTAASTLPDLLTRPVVRARDVHGNTDKDYSATSLAITTTGGMSTTPNTLSMAAGVAAFPPTFQYQDDGDGTLTVSDGPGGLVDAVSSTVTVTYSNTTSITAGAVANISSLKTAAPYFRVFDFNIIDDNGSGGDGAPTRFNNLVLTEGPGDDFSDWAEAIPVGGAQLFDGTNSITGAITSNTITFSGINVSTLGYIADNATKTYQLRIYLKASLGGTLPDDVDGKNFVFRVQDIPASVTTDALSSAFTGANDINSGSTNISVNVDASKLQFSADPASTLLVGKDVSAQLPIPVVEALDANNNRDLSYNSATVTVTNSGSLIMANVPGNASFINGLLTFPGTFKFTTTGTGVTLNVASTGPSVVTSTSSTSFDVRGGDAGTITTGALIEPPTISSLVDLTHTPAGLPVFDFTINDDPAGTPAGENDGNPTQLTSLFITSGVGNTVLGWDNAFATATLSDGTNTVTVTNIDASNYFYFDLSSATGQALGLIADNGSKTYTLRVWLKTALGDTLPITIDGKNLVFDMQKSNITTGVNSSKILAGQTQNSGAGNNKVDVTATQINYSQLLDATNFISPYSTSNFPASGSIFTNFNPVLGVEAHDANKNRDLDFTGSITFFAPVTAGVTTQNDPSGAFNAGTLKFPANFNYTAGNNQDGKLRMSAGGISNQDSPTINIISSFESQLVNDNTISTQNIDFVNYQATNITTTSATTTNAYTLDLMYLYDGGIDKHDADGASTSLDDLTLGLSNAQSIRRIAIYTKDLTTGNVTEVADYDITDVVALTPTIVNGYTKITFTNLNIVAPDNALATDNDYRQILVLATFKNTPTTITDGDFIKIAVLGATLNVGSKFAPDAAQTGTIGGVATSTLLFPEASGLAIVGTKGYLSKLEVTATSLDFEDDTLTPKQPSAIAGKQEPIDGSAGASPGGNTGIVYARDKFGIIDTDFNSTASVSAGANPFGYPAAFVAGVLNLTGMKYQDAGDGKLRVTAGALDSNVTPADNIGNYTPSSAVDVIHVKAIHDINTVDQVQSLKGGTTSKRIFGINFSSEHSTTTEPKLNGFSITFKNDDLEPYPYTKGASSNVFKNFKLFVAEGTGSPQILNAGSDYTLTEEQSYALTQVNPVPPAAYKDKLTFVLTNPVPLYLNNYRFYLEVDVDVSVSVGTPPITPYLQDEGYGFQTNNHIQTTVGSSTANVQGITRKFASTKPPVLVFTSPANGKLNVDPALNTIQLKFDVPVVTFDGIIKVYNRESGALRAIFTATNGVYVDNGTPLKDQVVPQLNFNAPSGFDFLPDTVYYVTVEKGVFSNTDISQRKGISDEGFNLYGGISYSGTFYFKGSSLIAPALISTDASKYYFTPTSATFNYQFDKPGKVHYLVLHPTTPSIAPTMVTNNQIDGIDVSLDGNLVARGVTTIDQQSPNLQYTTINAQLANGVDYFVYAYAENDAEPTPVKTGFPSPNGAYGAYIADVNPNNDYVVGNAGPTFKIKKAAAATNPINNPRFEICVNSSVKMEEPIIISETTAGEFATGFTSGASIGATQTFNILLPTGFQFDVTKTPTVKFNGADFGSLPVTTNVSRYRNSALLEINFINSTTTALNNIIISDLYLIASSADIGGNIIRFGGNGLKTVLDDRVLARITAGAATSISFINSYEAANYPWPYPQIAGANPYKPITYIPDNFAPTVKLIPDPPDGDYGSSFFSGAGLTNDVLTLSAVTLDASFNITLNHTDQNGCATTKTEQYLVYDHTNAIPELLKTPVAPTYQVSTTKIGLIAGTPDPVTNIPGLPSATLNPTDSVSYLGLAGYQLLDLHADIPERVKNLANPQFLDYNNPGWKTLVNNIPRLKSSFIDTNLGQTFKSYNWEYSNLINKNSTDAALVQYPYDPNTVSNSRFARVVNSSGTANQKTYFEAGSLGIIEFTGVYQSTADFSVFIPFRQEVELFIPAVPVIEVDGESGIAGNTPIFCEKGSPFIITGYPLANSSEVTGFFTLKDSVSNTPIIDAGFVDNGNGTASFNPSSSVLKNNYKSIKVEYTFKQNDSPAVGTGILYIRVTPNPLPDFTTTTLCEDLNVTFTDTTPLNPLASDVFNEKWLWNFGDPSSAVNTDTLKTPVHKYLDSGLKSPVTLSVITNFGCASVLPKSVSLEIGGTPNVGFTFEGVSVNDQIAFTNASTVTSNDSFGQLDWTFGDGATQSVTSGFAAVQNHSYLLPNHYDVKLKVTSTIGCVNEASQRIVVLSNATPTPIDSYIEHFEVNNGKWISSSVPTSSYKNNRSTWEIGNPTSAVIKITDATTFGNGVAKTNLDSTYRAQETSAFYSPSFDLSQLARPMISFNSFAQMEVGDGVIVQYSVDNKNVADPDKKWYVLGDNLNEGVDWFNTSGITAKPGGQPDKDFGWSGFDKSEWSESKHVIANASGKADVVGKTRVVFRFALASAKQGAADITHDGFAFDNFRIGERTRTILLENFTSTNGKDATQNGTIKTENKYLSDFQNSGFGTTVVKLNYHTGFTGTDPFNVDNPADPSARALYYNVKDVPYAMLDGSRPVGATVFSAWGQQAYDTQTLQLGQADISVPPTSLTTNADGSIKFDVKVTALYDLPANTIVHVALIEQSVTGGLSAIQSTQVKTGESNFDFVLKKMLPNALGTRLGTVLAKDEFRTFPDFEHYPDPSKLYATSNDLAIIVFLQNEDTKLIYQTEYITGISDPPTVTGLEDGLRIEDVTLYPNPADNELNILLPRKAIGDVTIQLFDQVGKSVLNSTIKNGDQKGALNVQGLAESMYLMRLVENGVITMKKVIVVHQN